MFVVARRERADEARRRHHRRQGVGRGARRAGTWRGYEAGPDGLELLVFGAPKLGDNPRDDVEGRRDWWAD